MSVAAACLQRAGGGKDELCWGLGLGPGVVGTLHVGISTPSLPTFSSCGAVAPTLVSAHFSPAAFPACVLPASAAS